MRQPETIQTLESTRSITFNLGDNDFDSPEEGVEYLKLMRDLKLRKERQQEIEEQERRWVQRKLDTDREMLMLGLSRLTFLELENLIECK